MASRTLEAQFGDHTMDQLRRVGARDTDDLDMFVAMIAGIATVQIGNDPHGDRWLRRSDEIVDLYLMYLAGRHG